MDIKETAAKTLDTATTQKHIVVCKQCGSTLVELCGVGASSKVSCRSCGNEMSWDLARFILLEDEPDAENQTVVGTDQKLRAAEREAKQRAERESNTPSESGMGSEAS
jgi:hypothetical protein